MEKGRSQPIESEITMIELPLTSRGLLELGIDEHRGNVTVKRQRLHAQAKLTVYRLGVLDEDGTEVEIKPHV